MKALVVDDDHIIQRIVTQALQHAGYDVVVASSGLEALDIFRAACPDIVLLDVSLPGLDGFEVCRRIRQHGPTPIIMLTASDDEEHIVRSFRLGADDYVTKPFSAKLLAARMNAVLRRTRAGEASRRHGRVQTEELELELETLTVRKGGEHVRLTPLEFRILYMLAANSGQVVPYNRLIEYAWGLEGGSPTHLKIRICNIRKKLHLPLDSRGGIKAVVGTGYVLQRAAA